MDYLQELNPFSQKKSK